MDEVGGGDLEEERELPALQLHLAVVERGHLVPLVAEHPHEGLLRGREPLRRAAPARGTPGPTPRATKAAQEGLGQRRPPAAAAAAAAAARGVVRGVARAAAVEAPARPVVARESCVLPDRPGLLRHGLHDLLAAGDLLLQLPIVAVVLLPLADRVGAELLLEADHSGEGWAPATGVGG